MSFHTKYRPATFDEVIGQASVVRSIQAAIGKSATRVFFFTGPAGTGKTTLARLIAKEAGCRPEDIIEIDAATHTGVDDMRAVTSTLRYRPLGEGSAKALIVDECHRLSKQAVEALLKNTEEPADYVWWMFCTTEPTKMPKTLLSRGARYDLKPVKKDDLFELLDRVAEEEGLDVTNGILDVCVDMAEGSPRFALTNLEVCLGARDEDEAAELLRSAAQSTEAIDLARALMNKAPWEDIQTILKGMGNDISPESVRHVVRGYFTTAVLNAKGDHKAGQSMEILDAFSEPFNPQDGISPLVLACGRVIFS